MAGFARVRIRRWGMLPIAAVGECAKLSPFLVEVHQRFNVLIVDRSAIGFARERRKNLLCADWFLSRFGGLTNENLPHAWRILRTLGKEWSGNAEEPDHGVI